MIWDLVGLDMEDVLFGNWGGVFVVYNYEEDLCNGFVFL